MTSVVTDTHALVWYIFDLERLSEAVLIAFEQAVNAGNHIWQGDRYLREDCDRHHLFLDLLPNWNLN